MGTNANGWNGLKHRFNDGGMEFWIYWQEGKLMEEMFQKRELEHSVDVVENSCGHIVAVWGREIILRWHRYVDKTNSGLALRPWTFSLVIPDGAIWHRLR